MPEIPGMRCSLSQASQGQTRGSVGRRFAEFGDDVTRDLRPVGFETRRIDSVIADERVGLDEDLTAIGRICDRFGIAGPCPY